MKTHLTKTEIDLRTQLEKSCSSIVSSPECERLRKVIRSVFPNFQAACGIFWNLGQDYEINGVLVDGEEVLSIEWDRFDLQEEPIIERVSIKDYMHGLKKMDRLKLAIAKEVCKEVILRKK